MFGNVSLSIKTSDKNKLMIDFSAYSAQLLILKFMGKDIDRTILTSYSAVVIYIFFSHFVSIDCVLHEAKIDLSTSLPRFKP